MGIAFRMDTKGIILVNNRNLAITATATAVSAPITKEKLNMIDPLGYHDYKVNEPNQDVQNFQEGNLRYFTKNWYMYIRDRAK